MAGITVSHLSFTYPQETVPALRDVSFSVEEGEFLTLIGPSGGGKSTLLRALKPALTPHGSFTGEISFFGEPLSALDARRQAAEIGFVLQKPDDQIVTDRVWHELAFGMESLGFATPVIRRRVAEMASFFGIEEWFSRPVEALSGGQKQLLNLASVMALQPRVLLLDEPTSQLDPIAAADFLNAVARIRRELGTTVILSEHRLEEALPLCDRVLALEQTVLAHGTPQEVSRTLRAAKSPVYFSMPTPVRVSGSVGADKCPVTVTEGRQWLAGYAASHPLADVPPRRLRPAGEELLGLRDVWFRYEKDGEDVLQDLSCSFARGQLTALLGGNGSGKTTTLSLLAGLRRPLRGKRFCRTERIGLLPQDPQLLFDRATVRDELREQLASLPEAEQARRMQEMACFCRLEGLLDRHPYDLSGGEQQRAALAKLLLAGPELLLLDEPTKGMDAQVKRELAAILNGLLEQGATVVMVSHDVEFCAQYADRCLLMFDGSIAAEGGPTDFFAGNHFYTTAANRMARRLLPQAVTCEELIAACGGTETPPPERREPPAAPPKDLLHPPEVKPLPHWRSLGALGLLGCVVTLFLQLTHKISIPFLAAVPQGALCVGLAVLLVGAMLLVSRRTGRASEAGPRRHLTKRTWVSLGVIALAVPATILCGVYLLGDRKYLFISLLVLLEVMLPFALLFERRGPTARELVLLAVLSALCVAGRAAFSALPQFKPVLALVIVSGVALGGEAGFLTGALAMLLSNVMYGQGPWTPWQMFAMGLCGFLAGVLYRRGLLRRGRVSLCIFGALSALLVYGVLMNVSSALLWQSPVSWATIGAYLLSGFPVDCVHAAATVCFLWLFGEPMLEKLDRIKVKYGLLA